jgi:hypothetical protein
VPAHTSLRSSRFAQQSATCSNASWRRVNRNSLTRWRGGPFLAILTTIRVSTDASQLGTSCYSSEHDNSRISIHFHWLVLVLAGPPAASCPKSIEENTAVVCCVGHDRFPTNPFQFMINPTIRRCMDCMYIPKGSKFTSTRTYIHIFISCVLLNALN